MTTNTAAVVDAMIHGRRADSTRRRQRVLTALDNAITDGAELSVTDIARRAGVDRTFLYRHRDLLERIHTADIQPPDKPGVGPSVTRASLQADLLAAQHFRQGRARQVAVGRAQAAGDRGARDYLSSRPVDQVECGDIGSGIDVDRPGQLGRAGLG